MSYIEKSIEDCIEDTEEYYEETEAIEAAEEVQKFQNPPKKAKKPRTQKQIDSLQKAREARAKNLASKKQEKMGAIKPPTKAAVEVVDVPQPNIKAAPNKPKKKARRKIVIQQQEESSDSSEEEVIVIQSKARKKKPKKKRQVRLAVQEPLDESSEDDEMYDDGHTMYDEQPKNYSQPTFRFI